MSKNRIVDYVDIDNPQQLNACVGLKKAVAEIDYFLAIFETNESAKIYVPVIYVFCETLAGFYQVRGEDGSIKIKKLAMTLAHLQNLLKRYHQFFIHFDPVNYRSFEPAQQEQLEEVWMEIFTAFIPPYDFKCQPAKSTNIFIAVEGIEGIGFPLDLGMIFDLRYHFMDIAHNIGYYVMSVAGLSLGRFAENIVGLQLPVYKNTRLLFGFEEYYTPEALVGMSEEIRVLAMQRKELYQQMLANAQMAGVTVVEMEHPADLIRHFHRTETGKYLQVVTHFNKSTDHPGRMRFKQSELRIDILEKRLKSMMERGTLRDDIVIDMLTCTNFYDFRQFYQLGVKYMFLSHHDYDTDQIAFYLNELYTGCNALKLGWNNIYLDGNHHVHEARSDVYRCFFRLGFKQCAITLDQKQYNMTADAMKFTGPLGEEFLIFSEDKKEVATAYAPMQIQPARQVGAGKLASTEELVMTLIIIGQDLIRDLIMDFIKDRIRKKKNFTVSYTVTNENNDSMTITEKDLTKEEVDQRFNMFKGNIVDVKTTAD